MRGIDLARGRVRVEVRRRVEVRGGVEVRGRVRVRGRSTLFEREHACGVTAAVQL